MPRSRPCIASIVLGLLPLFVASQTARAGQAAAPRPPAAAGAPGAAPARIDFDTQIAPLLDKYCVSCHGPQKKKGDLDLVAHMKKAPAARLADLHVWQSVAERVEGQDMPPEEQPQPSAAEAERLLAWIDAAAGQVAASGKRDPGRVTVRRLNRAEYDNTVRDLLGLDLKPAQEFPSDDVGYGFDNIGDVLTMPPVLVERYVQAAERIAERAIAGEVPPRPRRQTFQAERLAPTPAGATVRGGTLLLGASGAVRTRHAFLISGEYLFKVRASGRAAGGEAPRLALRIDGQEVEALEVRGGPRTYVVKAAVDAGPRRIELAFENGPAAAPPGRATRQLGLDALVVEGPTPGSWTLPASHFRLIPRSPGKETWRQDARAFLAPLASRAYRRPATEAEVDRLARFVEATVDEGGTFEQGMQMALRAILVSPKFLFRVELEDTDPAAPQADAIPLDDHALASRLSYFLWSSMPDDELFRLAREGTLRDPETLEAQVRRMIADPKAQALVQNFATQWLQTRNLAGVRPNRRQFPGFDDELRAAMAKETELFFEAIMREDLPIGTFLDASFTFVNEKLARHYGLEGVKGPAFRRVTLEGGIRGGVLTHASVLTVTSNPTRTSPVKRGRWVMEQILGTPPPPPPPGVPELPEQNGRRGEKPKSLRAQMEQHRADPNCATCHRKMDPLGFGLETFDAVGALRTHEENEPVDASGELPGGVRFDGPAGLKAILKTKEPQFRRALATRLLTYALGRGTEPFDRPAIDEIAAHAERNGNTFTSLVVGVVRSDPFGKRRGPTAVTAAK